MGSLETKIDDLMKVIIFEMMKGVREVGEVSGRGRLILWANYQKIIRFPSNENIIVNFIMHCMYLLLLL